MAAEHQRLLDAWRELWGQYKAIIDAFDGLIYICSAACEIEFVNRHLAEMLGYSPLGQKCYQAFYNLDHPCPRCSKEEVLRGETIRQQCFNPQNNRTYYQVATPIYLKSETLMMMNSSLRSRRQRNCFQLSTRREATSMAFFNASMSASEVKSKEGMAIIRSGRRSDRAR